MVLGWVQSRSKTRALEQGSFSSFEAACVSKQVLVPIFATRCSTEHNGGCHVGQFQNLPPGTALTTNGAAILVRSNVCHQVQHWAQWAVPHWIGGSHVWQANWALGSWKELILYNSGCQMSTMMAWWLKWAAFSGVRGLKIKKINKGTCQCQRCVAWARGLWIEYWYPGGRGGVPPLRLQQWWRWPHSICFCHKTTDCEGCLYWFFPCHPF